jgi:uncharacterized protein (DUF488 family)
MTEPRPHIWTVGHGAGPVDELIDVLREVGVERLVDVRTAPGSRKHPQFGRAALADSLEANGIAYVWRKELGGWRKPKADSRHVALESAGFRGYADHMETEEFERALSWLLESSSDTRTAFMCAETLWWRCHRRMIADALMARGVDVIHLMPGGKAQAHKLHPAARLDGTNVIYDVSSKLL